MGEFHGIWKKVVTTSLSIRIQQRGLWIWALLITKAWEIGQMNFSLSFSLHMRASGTEKVSLEEAEVHEPGLSWSSDDRAAVGRTRRINQREGVGWGKQGRAHVKALWWERAWAMAETQNTNLSRVNQGEGVCVEQRSWMGRQACLYCSLLTP